MVLVGKLISRGEFGNLLPRLCGGSHGPPEVFVRDLSIQEGRRLQRISRTAKDPVKLRRAIVVMMSAQDQSVPDITTLMQVSADYVRNVIHAFNERGFAALGPKWSRGPAPTISTETREHIGLIARTAPAEGGIGERSTWSLRTLAAALGRVPGDFIEPGALGLAVLRARAGLSQRQVVARLADPELRVEWYRSVESGQVRRLRHMDAHALAGVLGVSTEEVLAAHRVDVQRREERGEEVGRG